MKCRHLIFHRRMGSVSVQHRQHTAEFSPFCWPHSCSGRTVLFLMLTDCLGQFSTQSLLKQNFTEPVKSRGKKELLKAFPGGVYTLRIRSLHCPQVQMRQRRTGQDGGAEQPWVQVPDLFLQVPPWPQTQVLQKEKRFPAQVSFHAGSFKCGFLYPQSL